MKQVANDAARIRPARPEDAAELSAIAFAAKAHWGYPAEWMELWREALTITPETIAAGRVRVLEQDGRVVGFHSVSRAPEGYELDDLWVLPEAMGRGHGRRLVEDARALVAAEEPGATIRIEADPNAEGFYLQLGARRVGERIRQWQGLERRLPLLELAPVPNANR